MGVFRDEKKIASLLEEIGGVQTPVSEDLEERMISGLEGIVANNFYTVDEYTFAPGYNVGNSIDFNKIRDLQIKQRGKYFTKHKQRQNVIAEFVGDSLFVNNQGAENYAIGNYFGAFYDYIHGQNLMSVYINAVVGDPSKAIYERTDPAGSENADIVFFTAGTNDAAYFADGQSGYTIEDYAANIIKIISKYVLRGAYVIFCTTPPCQKFFSQSDTGAQLAHEYSRTAKIICNYFGVPTFDAQAALNGYAYNDVTIDGLHFTDKAEQTYAMKLLCFATGRGIENILRLKAGISVRADNLDFIGAVTTSGVSLVASNESTAYIDTYIDSAVAGAIKIQNTANGQALYTVPVYVESDNVYIIPNFKTVGADTSVSIELSGGCTPYIINPLRVAPEATQAISTEQKVDITSNNHGISIDANGFKTMSNALFVANRGLHILSFIVEGANAISELTGFDVVAYNELNTGGTNDSIFVATVNTTTNAQIWNAITAGKTVIAREAANTQGVQMYTYFQSYFMSEQFAIFNAVLIDTSDSDKKKIKQYIVTNNTWTLREAEVAGVTS